MHYQTTKTPKFGKGTQILRARYGESLTLPQMKAAAPSIFAETPHVSRTDRYTYIPTSQILEGLVSEGFQPVEVRQASSRDEEKRAFTKHLVRLRHASALEVMGTRPEIILLNSHDGTSSYQILSGFFRMVCQNGLITSESEHDSIRVPHKGNVRDAVIEGCIDVLDAAPRRNEMIQEFAGISLAPMEREVFAAAALEYRYPQIEGQPVREIPVTAEQVTRPRRTADSGSDLWATFNRVQENLVTGGISYVHRDRAGNNRRGTTRAVGGIDSNVQLNRALWVLAEKMAELKRA